MCEFFHAPPDEYLCVFTPNATGALRLVGESYRFEPGGTFALTFDNHNSVNGIREFARRRGAAIAYVPVVAPELRLDRAAMTSVLGAADPVDAEPARLSRPSRTSPAFSIRSTSSTRPTRPDGTSSSTPPRSLRPTGSTSRRVRPDFVAISFYKIIGFPTGVGCLLVRRDRLDSLARPWFSGGTVTIASVQGDGHYLRPDDGAFEDGTVDYLNIPAVAVGLRYIERIGLDAIHQRVDVPHAVAARRDDRAPPSRRSLASIEIHGPTDIDRPWRHGGVPRPRP